jgi:hypothetical protein
MCAILVRLYNAPPDALYCVVATQDVVLLIDVIDE